MTATSNTPIFSLFFALSLTCFAGHSVAHAQSGPAPTAEARFTNPNCPSRSYLGYFEPTAPAESPLTPGFAYALPQFVGGGSTPVAVPLRDGTTRSATKPGVYCFQSDSEASVERPDSVYSRIKDMLSSTTDQDTIKISTFSFSERRINKLLCDALTRGTKVQIVYGSPSPVVEGLSTGSCAAALKAEVYYGGASGGESARLQHSKYILVERPSASQASLTFQSANITSGVSLHHENWTFVELPLRDELIVRHQCHFGALFSSHFNKYDVGIAGFRASIKQCMETNTPSMLAPALAIQPYFVPSQTDDKLDGKRAIDDLVAEIVKADAIDVISHHLTYKPLLEALTAALQRGASVRVILDNELFWVGNSALPRDANGEPLFRTTDNRAALRDSSGAAPFDHYSSTALFVRGCSRGASFAIDEYETLVPLFAAGAAVRYIEANPRESLFQHNKFLVMRRGGAVSAVFTGAGNLSSAGFTRNGENFYLIKEPVLLKRFGEQYGYLWETLATPPEKLPVTWATQIEGDSSWPNWRSKIETPKQQCRR
jgi:hypothetical protein